jgi:hypothetical protein
MHTQWAYASAVANRQNQRGRSLYRRIAQSGNQVLAPEATKALVRIKSGQAPDLSPTPR